jgi:DNA-binding transcriptional ArsR family regulator
MVHYSQATFDRVATAIADPTRRKIIERLSRGPARISDVARPFSMSLTGFCKHVRVLERAGLLHRTVDGRRHVCQLRAAPLAQADAWLRWYEPFWPQRLDALDDLFREGGPNPEPPIFPNDWTE